MKMLLLLLVLEALVPRTPITDRTEAPQVLQPFLVQVAAVADRVQNLLQTQVFRVDRVEEEAVPEALVVLAVLQLLDKVLLEAQDGPEQRIQIYKAAAAVELLKQVRMDSQAWVVKVATECHPPLPDLPWRVAVVAAVVHFKILLALAVRVEEVMAADFRLRSLRKTVPLTLAAAVAAHHKLLLAPQAQVAPA